MSIIKDSSGNDVEVCDGCGRQDAGPGTPFEVREYLVRDPNRGIIAKHHYDNSCAANRGYLVEVVNEWPVDQG